MVLSPQAFTFNIAAIIAIPPNRMIPCPLASSCKNCKLARLHPMTQQAIAGVGIVSQVCSDSAFKSVSTESRVPKRHLLNFVI
jgi:hypothetical protein